MISDTIGAGGKGLEQSLEGFAGECPNALTFIRLLINIGCSVLYGYGCSSRPGW
jgi:hypothetical protein